MPKHYFKADITTPKGAPKIQYPEGWYENVNKIFVRAYDDVNHMCLAETEDEELFNKLMATGKVTKMSATKFASEIERLRPPPPDVEIILRSNGRNIKPDVETLLKAKNVTYRIEEA